MYKADDALNPKSYRMSRQTTHFDTESNTLRYTWKSIIAPLETKF